MRSKDGPSDTFTRAARRTQIVASAIEVIAEIGWAQTSIRKIADRVGIAMSAVLYHFGSKDHLVEAVIEHMYQTAVDAVAPAVGAETTAANRLAAHVRASIGYFDTHRANLAALTDLAATYRPSDGRRFADLGPGVEVAERLAAVDPVRILASGQRNGEFDDFPVDSMALVVRGAVNAAVERILTDPGFDADRYADDLVAILSRAVGARP